jgi:hypothetical protein
MHWKREKVTVDRLRVGDLVDLAENGQFEALMAPELDALKRVWPDHTVIRASTVSGRRLQRGTASRSSRVEGFTTARGRVRLIASVMISALARTLTPSASRL